MISNTEQCESTFVASIHAGGNNFVLHKYISELPDFRAPPEPEVTAHLFELLLYICECNHPSSFSPAAPLASIFIIGEAMVHCRQCSSHIQSDLDHNRMKHIVK